MPPTEDARVGSSALKLVGETSLGVAIFKGRVRYSVTEAASAEKNTSKEQEFECETAENKLNSQN